MRRVTVNAMEVRAECGYGFSASGDCISLRRRVFSRRDNEQRLFDMGSYLKLKCDNIFCRQVLVLMGDTALSTECNNPKDCRMSFDATIFLDSAFDRLWVSTE